jgi:chromosome segregation protein
MLKALELSGFKSFADKTRFDFPAGITVVVGPNGSGKSNIVDAIKWVLGEQSAKSLRGKDMSDVIFKGSSGANARKPANSASATIILDNSDGRLMSDSTEIHVTRRVYRSGESEYLINNEPCRLKDIRNLFRGTGVGTDAYSLIEQGKVERMLQASAKDRRAIFEEAAGISRFKAQKIEAERRLERVQTNLTRLADIVEEVGSRFRSIKNQASKASKYKEYTDRLQELRTYVGAKDFRALGERIETLKAQATTLQSQLESGKKDIVDLSTKHQDAEARVDKIASAADQLQESVAGIREQLSQAESSIEISRQRILDLNRRDKEVTESLGKQKSRLHEVTTNRTAVERDLAAGKKENAAVRTQLQQVGTAIAQADSSTQQLVMRGDESRKKSELLASVVRDLTQQISGHTVQIELQRQTHQKISAEASQLQTQVRQQQSLVSEIENRFSECNRKAESSDSALATARQSVETITQRLGELQARQHDLKTQHAGVSQRAKVIEELEKRLEGVSSGAQELLKSARRQNTDLADRIVGLVADLIQVNVQHAGIVDAALGDRAQYIVVKDERLAHDLSEGRLSVSGRVGILSLDGIYSLGSRLDIDLANVEGIIGSVDSLVDTGGIHSGFVRSLLRGTWIVNDLKTAFRMRREQSDQVRYVTLSGEILEADGTLVVGPKSSFEGLVSRRSELRALASQSEGLKQEIASIDQSIATLKSELKQGQAQVQKLINENQSLSKELAQFQAQLSAAQRDLKISQEKSTAVTQEISTVTQSLKLVEATLASLQSEYAKNNTLIESVVSFLTSTQSEVDRLQNQQRDLEKQENAARVQLAKSDQQLLDLESRLAEYAQAIIELEQSTSQAQSELDLIKQGMAEANEISTTASKKLNELTQQREAKSAEYNQLHTERLELDRNRKEIAAQLHKLRDSLHSKEEQLNELNFNSKRLELERNQLAERLKEDYGINVETIEQEATPEQLQNRDEIDREITELRQKIGSMGAVNMQALVELEELESRYQTLDQQYKDLVEARDSLLRIIQKINNDSRRLFVETLEAIRTNFQKLFRQTFGGGQADIILEEGVDVLEAGVEIIATPPGKPKFNNSLLSGGEKALTAVSLLMAIFQFRPSPFCVLDEVDAPFDEANIGRFIDVLKSFLGWTKFVIVTHSKKTMTAATTLYGITMQESGISKRVSVRFEDVSDDGQISKEAVKRSETEVAAGNQPAA